MDLSMSFEVTASATIIRTGAIQRSNRGALLKKIHQIIINNPQITPPNKPIAIVDGTIAGTTNLRSHCSITMITPGHSLSGFCSCESMVLLSAFIFFCFFDGLIFRYNFVLKF
jgi:hypothetical protein